MQTNVSLFASLVYTLHMTTLQQLGVVKNPGTGKQELDLPQAKVSIEMIDMLEQKTQGNLSETESDFLRESVIQLHQLYDQAVG